MSFRCNHCNFPQPAGSIPTKIVTKTRRVTYPSHDGFGVSVGSEIVKEIDCCTECVPKAEARSKVVDQVGKREARLIEMPF